MSQIAQSPAELAAEETRALICACIDQGKNFLVEAGAGAGKTYSLIEALNHLIEKRAGSLLRRQQRVACITYTNVATNEIETRTDRHPAIQPSTIHAFCWSLIRGFQPFLRNEIANLGKWPERLREAGADGIGNRLIDYNLGHPMVEEGRILLYHNDVLTLTVKALEQVKFRDLLTARYPILFIDEYQDTDSEFAEALKTHFVSTGKGPLIGLFGDHWQKIYGTGCGKIEHPNLQVIGKKSNFRSVAAIVNCLNRIRPELPQQVKDPNEPGFLAIYQTNRWQGTRRTGQHWNGDLPNDAAHAYLDSVKGLLAHEGWDFQKTKILMLTHRALAAEQGYSNLENVFQYNDSFIKKEDAHIAFLCDTVEPVCTAYEGKRFGEMFAVLGARTPAIQLLADKLKWTQDMDKLLALRKTGTIGEVLDYLKQTRRPRPSDAVEFRERQFYQTGPGQDLSADETTLIDLVRNLRKVPYQEVIALNRFINEETPFATKHGVKGAEFENVLVVIGRGWNLYDFNQFLEWAANPARITPGKDRDAFERNRNLFYVACSRPKKRLAILFTQKLSNEALTTLSKWFGSNSIHAL